MELIVFIAAVAIAAWLGHHYGMEAGKDIRDNQAANAAAAGRV